MICATFEYKYFTNLIRLTGLLYDLHSLIELTIVPQYLDTGQPQQSGYLSK